MKTSTEKKIVKSVGVLTMHRVTNYGSFLQAYATQEVIKSLGYKCEIIDYVFPNCWHYDNGLPKKNLKSKIADTIYKLGITKGLRKKKFIVQAINRYLDLSEKFNSPFEINRNPPSYDVYITGSDQTWNCKHMKGDTTFLLSFASETARKISFSASIAAKNMEERYVRNFKKYLDKYEAISVRDSNGNKVINQLLGKDSEITLDPTLVLSREQWSGFGSNKPQRYNDKKYIVFYLITHSFDPTPYIYNLLKKLQLQTGYEVISFSKIPDEFEINHTICFDINVEYFIQLFEHASCVVTSSFHGTAFAANFGVPMYSVVNDLDSGDDRQSSLLNKLGIDNCLVVSGSKFEDINPNYDFNKEQENLRLLREKSIDYLQKNI